MSTGFLNRFSTDCFCLCFTSNGVLLCFAASFFLCFSSGGVLLCFSASFFLCFSSGGVLLCFSASFFLCFSSGGVLLRFAACSLQSSSTSGIVGFLFVFRGVVDPTPNQALGWSMSHGVDGPRQWQQEETKSDSKRVLAHGIAPFHLFGTFSVEAVFQKRKIYTLSYASGSD